MNESYLTEFRNVLPKRYEQEKEKFEYIDWITTEHDMP